MVFHHFHLRDRRLLVFSLLPGAQWTSM